MKYAKTSDIILPLILLAVAFVILLVTIYPYYRLNHPELFINPKDYQCPQSEWVNCMPGPGIANPQCSSEYLNWAKSNCSNFKGAAL